MVTWGQNTTAVFGAGSSAAAPATPAPPPTAFPFGGGGAPATPPAASTPAPSNPPPLASAAMGGAPAPAAGGGLFGGTPAPAPTGGLFGATPGESCRMVLQLSLRAIRCYHWRPRKLWSEPRPHIHIFNDNNFHVCLRLRYHAAPAPTGGLFGSTPAPAPTGSLFGSTPAPAPGGGLFGSTPAPAPAGGLFGTTRAPAPAGGLFGSTSTAAPSTAFGAAPAPSAFGGFGTQQPQPQANPHQAALHAHQSASQRQEAARIEEAIFNLHSKYSPVAADPLNPALASNNMPSSLCAFTAILYDPLPPEHRTQGHLAAPKPAHVSNQVWNEALARNPDPAELMPVALVGAAALHSRIVSQQEKANAMAAHAEKLRDTLRFLERAARSSREAIDHSNAEQEALRRRLLEIMRKVEIVRCIGQPTQPAEVEARRRLGEVARQAGAVGKALSDLEERGRRQARAWRMRGAAAGPARQAGAGMAPLSEDDRGALFHVLNEQRLGMERLGHIVKRDVRDVNILKKELNNAASSSGALPPSSAAIFGGR
ncbi:hypothetical protein ACHAWF_008027 [Thalassiosira exigua]